MHKILSKQKGIWFVEPISVNESEIIVGGNGKMAQNITKVRKNSEGDITQVMLNDGSIHTVKQAIRMAQQNQLQNVIVGQARNGRQTIRSRGNETKADNLSNLPTF